MLLDDVLPSITLVVADDISHYMKCEYIIRHLSFNLRKTADFPYPIREGYYGVFAVYILSLQNICDCSSFIFIISSFDCYNVWQIIDREGDLSAC